MMAPETTKHASHVTHMLLCLLLQRIEKTSSGIFRLLRVLCTARNFLSELIDGLIYLLFCQVLCRFELAMTDWAALLSGFRLLWQLTLMILAILVGFLI